MLLLLVLVFASVFIVFALVLIASGTGASERTKQTLAVLESALVSEKAESHDQIVDVRREDLLSAVPWINRWLLKLEIAPRLRILLYQANLKWTAGGLLLMTFACFAVPSYLLYLRTGAGIFSFLFGALLGAAPIMYVIQKAQTAFLQI